MEAQLMLKVATRCDAQSEYSQRAIRLSRRRSARPPPAIEVRMKTTTTMRRTVGWRRETFRHTSVMTTAADAQSTEN